MKYALITGASSGIGLELAKVMAVHGHHLILASRNVDFLHALKAELKKSYDINIEVRGTDLTIPGEAQALYDFCRERGFEVEILVNNAGFGDYGHFDASRLPNYRNMLQLNITALTELTALFLENMKQRAAGKVLNVASLAGFLPSPNLAVYAATKAYVMHFTEALNYELRGSGVTATVLNPGITETGFVSRAGMGTAKMAGSRLMDARTVAEIGYAGMMSGKLNVVPGWKNRLAAFGSMTTPSREILLRIGAMVFKENSATH